MFVRNSATLDVTKHSLGTVIFNTKEMLNILDKVKRTLNKIKNKIKCGVLQKKLSKYFRFESTNILCEQFNQFINTLKNKKEETNDNYPNYPKHKIHFC